VRFIVYSCLVLGLRVTGGVAVRALYRIMIWMGETEIFSHFTFSYVIFGFILT
jgi:hypothetical protein